MKSSQQILCTLAISLIFGSLTPVQAGWETGNGGDDVGLEFKNLANKIGKKSSAFYFTLLNPSQLQSLKAAIESTRVEVTDLALILDGVAKDAVNFPAQKLIRVNRARWNGIPDDNRRIRLVFHEYLMVAGIDDSHYEISSSLFSPWADPKGILREKVDHVIYEVMNLVQFLKESTSVNGQICLDGGRLIQEVNQVQEFYLDVDSEITIDSELPLGKRRPYLALIGYSMPIHDYCLAPDTPKSRSDLIVRLLGGKQRLDVLLEALGS